MEDDDTVLQFKKRHPNLSDLPTRTIETAYNLPFMDERRLKYLRQHDPERTAHMEAAFVEMLAATISQRMMAIQPRDTSIAGLREKATAAAEKLHGLAAMMDEARRRKSDAEDA